MVARLPFVRLRPRADTFYVSQGRTVFETDAEGWIPEGGAHGLFVYQTRLLSRVSLVGRRGGAARRWRSPTSSSTLRSATTSARPGRRPTLAPPRAVDVNEHTVELRVSRYVGGGVHEDVDVTNYSGWPVSLRLTLEVDADFAGPGELYGESGRVRGKLDRRWNATVEGDRWTLVFEYRAEHAFDRQGNQGVARIDRGLALEIHRAGSPPRWSDGRIDFTIELEPLATWHTCIDLVARIEDRVLVPAYGCRSFAATDTPLDRLREAFLSRSTDLETACSSDLSAVVERSIDTAKRDLAALRLYDLDQGERAWTMAAGLPIYIALFGATP